MVLKYNLFTETSGIVYNYVKRHSWIYDYALYPYRNLWAKRRILLIQSSRIGLLKKRWITLIFLSLDPRWIPKATHCDLVKDVFPRFWPVMCVYSDFWLVPSDSILCSHWPSGAHLFAVFHNSGKVFLSIYPFFTDTRRKRTLVSGYQTLHRHQRK